MIRYVLTPAVLIASPIAAQIVTSPVKLTDNSPDTPGIIIVNAKTTPPLKGDDRFPVPRRSALAVQRCDTMRCPGGANCREDRRSASRGRLQGSGRVGAVDLCQQGWNLWQHLHHARDGCRAA